MTDESQIDVQLGELIADDVAGVPDVGWLADWVNAALTGHAGAVTVRIVGAAEMQALNRDYRDADKPTNVLSFPAGTIEGLPPEESGPLGDIVVCADVVMEEAREQGKAPEDHWAHLLVHGTLHLLGYDHMTEAEAEEMERLEIRLLEAGGVGNPYVSR